MSRLDWNQGLVALSLSALLAVACGSDDEGGGSGGSGGSDASVAGGTGGDGGGSGGATDGGSGGADGGAGGTSGGGAGGAAGSGGGGTSTIDAGSDASVDASLGGSAGAEAGSDATVTPGDAATADAGNVDAGGPCDTTGSTSVEDEGEVTGTGTYAGTDGGTRSDPEYARDDDPARSWWTEATFGSQLFTWTVAADKCIDAIILTNTSGDTLFGGVWAGWSFDQVKIRIRNETGAEVWTTTTAFGNTSPNIDVGGVRGNRIEFEFSGFSEAYGGLSEFVVFAAP